MTLPAIPPVRKQKSTAFSIHHNKLCRGPHKEYKYNNNIMNDFLKYAKAQGLNTMHVEHMMRDSYISPSILEERQLNVTQMDVFSRLMMDRIIFLGTAIDDYVANIIQAQLLFLDDEMGLLGAIVTNLGINALDEQTDFRRFPAAEGTNT